MNIFIVVRPDADFDFVLAGVFNNEKAAKECAADDSYSYVGEVYSITPDMIESTYVADEEE